MNSKMKARYSIILSSLALLLLSCGPGRQYDPSQTAQWPAYPLGIQAILDSLPNDYERSIYLRELTSRVVDMSVSKDNSNIDSLFPGWNQQPVMEIVSIFQEDKASGVCGNTSDLLCKLYDDFGFRSYILRVGGDHLAESHAVVLVRIEHEGEELLILQDPFFNYVLADEMGNPIGFWEVCRLLKKERSDEIKRWGSFIPTDVLLNKNLSHEESAQAYKKRKEEIFPAASGSRFKFITERNIEEMVESNGPLNSQILEMIESYGFPGELKYWYLCEPVVYGTRAEEIQNRLNSLLEDWKK